MDAGLGGEGRSADIWRLRIGGAVDQIVKLVAHPRQLPEPVAVDAHFEAVGIERLQQQRRDQRHQIGVAAALADAIERALDLARTGFDGGERIGDRLAAVVMGMDAEPIAGNAGSNYLRNDIAHFGRLGAAIGVAQHHPAGAGIVGGFCAGERIVAVGLEAVEEMLAIDHRFAAGGNGALDRIADAGEVFLVGRAERDTHVIVPALGDEADRVGLGFEQRGKARIVRGRHPWPARHAEADEGGTLRALFREEFGVGRVGAGIAALDIVDAEFVEEFGNGDLVGDRKIDARRLLAVAQGRVEEIKAIFSLSHGFAQQPLLNR